ncbi:unnamed protein product [Brachionus calyciflorus]|uniref:Ras-specific guanine nucleotide-releasing factor 1 n=1 Tax=Brachionus calyciflorus TaxID=104777 RepID=A0A813PHJ7_9BILA|nr:unnamed protein product [Brachionus calyciflorus]
MQRNGCKINEAHLNTIALKARLEHRECGYLWKRSNDSNGKWQIKWFALYQNFLFYYETVNSTKPLGLIILESCYCNRIVTNTKNTKEGEIKLFCFSLSYSKDGKNPMEFGAETEEECIQWMEAIKNCSYSKQTSQNAELQHKYLHVNQLYETESKSKWQYLAQVEELSNEVKQLREELKHFKGQNQILKTKVEEESSDMKRIKKVQSLCRGWLYRRRWKRIVKDYIESPDALNLRKRNRIVFELFEKEGEYMSQLEILVSNFLRPFKMAACSSKPPVTHEEINCIFLNSEILLFLHQIFYKGLNKKLENWPSVFVGDLFDFLLPVLVIYQEYVRNHHYSLQILTDLKIKSIEFRNLLKRCEEKPKCEGRSLDIFLTYPMHQIPRYILILHQLISFTSHTSTNELYCLENAKKKLEELSRSMHDEVSETENIRCNLAIEKMIVEGCEVILDANQVFIREGLLIILTSLKSKTLGVKLKDVKKRNVVKCFLFTNHLIVTTRASNGRLNLFKPYEAIPLSECKIIEDVTNEISMIEEENMSLMSDDHSISSVSIMSTESNGSLFFNKDQPADYSSEFKLIQSNNLIHRSINFIASSLGEKQAWCGDISQCIDNLNYSSLLQNTNTSNSVNMPNKAMPYTDQKLFRDEKDVKYCKSLNSCKVPQIRQATLDKLIERLTDLRFLSIDFLNTFLLTYRVFADPFLILNALKNLYESSPKHSIENGEIDIRNDINNELNRRVSVAGLFRLPSINEERDVYIKRGSRLSSFRRDLAIDIENLNIIEKDETETPEADTDPKQVPSSSINNNLQNQKSKNELPAPRLAPIASCETLQTCSSSTNCSINLKEKEDEKKKLNDSVYNTQNITSNIHEKTNNLIENVLNNLKKVNVSDGIFSIKTEKKFRGSTKPLAASLDLKEAEKSNLNNTSINQNTLKNDDDYIDEKNEDEDFISDEEYDYRIDSSNRIKYKDFISGNKSFNGSISSATSCASRLTYWKDTPEKPTGLLTSKKYSSNTTEALSLSPAMASKRTSLHKNSQSLTTNQLLMAVQQNAQKITKRLSDTFSVQKILSDNHNRKLPISVYAGVVVTSSRSSRRRTSNSEATKAFAIATSGSQTSLDKAQTFRHSLDSAKTPVLSHRVDRVNSTGPSLDCSKTKKNWAIVNTAASMRVLNVLRHWITKHPLDFDENLKLKEETLNLINQMLNESHLTDTERKVAKQIIQQLTIPLEKKKENLIDIDTLLRPPTTPGKVKFSELSVSEIAEQMTYIDYQIFASISSQELLGQAWMKVGKERNAKNVLLFSKRFNEMSQLVVSEIIMSANHSQRLEKLEKWTTIANICKFLKNFNGVLQIMSAFASTSVFRLKSIWDKLSKNSQQTIETLQNLVSSDGRFKNLRDAMNKCDPPCIPYLGMYLMDLVFIEESTPDFLERNLINFSKLRMVSHIIRDIRTFQQSKYSIHHNRRVCEYLLDTSSLLTPDEAYNKSLTLEPRNSINPTTRRIDENNNNENRLCPNFIS